MATTTSGLKCSPCQSGSLSLNPFQELTRALFRLKTISHPVQNLHGVGGTQQHHHSWSALLCIAGSRASTDSPFFLGKSHDNRFFPTTHYDIPGLLLDAYDKSDLRLLIFDADENGATHKVV